MNTSTFTKQIFIFLSFTGVFFACRSNDATEDEAMMEVQSEEKYKEVTKEQAEKLVYSFGNKESDTVIVNIQGGPTTELEKERFKEIISVSGADTGSYLFSTVHQAQTINPKKITEQDITFEEALLMTEESIRYLDTVISYYKNEKKVVFVLGISVGTFFSQELISKKGIDFADKFLLMVGRLDIEEGFWKAYQEGKEGIYENGRDFVISEQDNVEDRNLSRLAATLGKNRYTDSLKSIKDLSKITYVYSTGDEAVGSLTEAEINFLENGSASVIKAEKLSHWETVEGYIKQGFKSAYGIE